MTRLNWNPSTRTFETGLDRGVLYPKTGPAVPWNGLTGVDEDGAQEAQVYYLEGRPYLNVPTPKEFTAQIRAYTYPDEFSPMMGIIEATDGMYLDSQQSDSFDLSYRTLIGDGVTGENSGYKIHLLYNVTVTPDGASYVTVGSSIEPTEFTWKVTTVPVQIPGYRATAHVTIDTRHMSASSIAKIENMLYGSDSSVPYLPTPDVVLNTLSFGDEIVITDNGDGTWTAEGSYSNITKFANGNFRLDNVDATIDMTNGTYVLGPNLIMIVDGGTSDTVNSDAYDGGTPASTGLPILDGGEILSP